MANTPFYTPITQPLFPEAYFHVYNHANGEHNLFFQAENYRHFLKRLNHYLHGYVEFHAFCLMPNHFHLLIRVKSSAQILALAKQDFPNGLTNKEHPTLKQINTLTELSSFEAAAIISERFRLLFMSYAKGINKQEKRQGSLFRKYMRRKPIIGEAYYRNCLAYIHRNPAHHGFTPVWKKYEWSSYGRILIDKPSNLQKAEVLAIIEGKENYVLFHDAYDEGSQDDVNWALEE